MFEFMKECVIHYAGIPLKAIHYFCKNDGNNKNRISTFEVRILVNSHYYAYGFDTNLFQQTIEDEWIIDLGKNKVLYQRSKSLLKLDLSAQDKNRMNIYMNDFSDNNKTLFLSEMNHNKKIEVGSELICFKEIFDWFKNDLNVIYPDMPVTNFEYYYDENSLENVKKLIQTFDTGIQDIKIRRIEKEELQSKIGRTMYMDVINKLQNKIKEDTNHNIRLSMRSKKEFFNIDMNKDFELKITTLSFSHGNSPFDFDFDEESDGTRRVFDLLDILLNKNQKSVYVIDEMERSLHPNLFTHFLELLNEHQKTSDVQLIFTTHEASIMNQKLFRRDQIWFVNRDQNNNSSLYSLDQFNERFDKKINKAYLEGRYGAVPIFKDFDLNTIE